MWQDAMEKQLKPIFACPAALIAGALIARSFDIEANSQAAGAIRVNSTCNAGRDSRGNHDRAYLADLSSNLESLRAAETSMYQGTGRNIFQIAVERSSAQAVRQNDMLELKSPPTIATFSIPLKFYGFSHDRKARSIFLLKESDIFYRPRGRHRGPALQDRAHRTEFSGGRRPLEQSATETVVRRSAVT